MMRRRILARLLPALFLAPALLSMTAPARAQPADAGQRLLQEGARIQAVPRPASLPATSGAAKFPLLLWASGHTRAHLRLRGDSESSCCH